MNLLEKDMETIRSNLFVLWPNFELVDLSAEFVYVEVFSSLFTTPFISAEKNDVFPSPC